MEGAVRHKDHYHGAAGDKFYGNAALSDKADLTPHKDHFHDKEGVKVYGQPGGHDEHDEPPTEKDVVQESVKSQRRSLKRGKAKTSSINTMLQSTGGQRGHKLG
jgi:hypothetical protein